jgi:protein-S-isoprenylcysteine O-methyltransferase Ste14
MTLVTQLAALEQQPLVRALATSEWAYPLVSTLHLLGIALLIGGIAAVDLRLLGMWRHGFDPAVLARLRGIAAVGLLLALLSGLALFSVRGSEYIENPWLLRKWAFVAGGVVNALAYAAWTHRGAASLDSPRARAAGVVSMGCWLGALACGRWIAFA